MEKMRARLPRFGIRRPVQFYRVDELVRAFTDDLSQRGAFVHTDAWLPVNGVVDLCVMLSERDPIIIPARVAYCLAPEQAQALGRRAGIGFQFLPSQHKRLDTLERYVQAIGRTGLPQRAPQRARVLVACEPRRLRMRLVHALSSSSFDVVAVASGAELYAQARAERWDALCVDESIGGIRWLPSLVGDVRSGAAPVLFVSDGDDEIARLTAYRAGAADYLPRPFTDEELRLRVLRLAARRSRLPTADFVGDLSRMPLSSVLTLLEHEHASGLLQVHGELQQVSIAFSAGEICAVNGSGDASARNVLLDALTWSQGFFEYRTVAVTPAIADPWPVAGALLESARRVDEQRGALHDLTGQAPRRRASTPASG